MQTRIPPRDGRSAFIRSKPIDAADGSSVFPSSAMMTLNNFVLIVRSSSTDDGSFKCLPYQLSMVGSTPTMVVTGNGESGFDSGEGA